jgi:hypothetical protein
MIRMLQTLKKISWLLLLALGLQTSWAFSLLGPIANGGDAWQVSPIGYNYPGTADIGEPKNIVESYRRNTPIMYYACDANFLDFFGSTGSAEIDKAFVLLNNCLTNVDGYSSALTEFPLVGQSVNYQANALELDDLKSETLGAMVEQLGLANPVRFAWTLHDRYLPTGAQCPAYQYLVVQRNFYFTNSPVSLYYSPYVNGTLYTYFIYEVCPASVPDPQALAWPVQVDPLANSFTSLAGRSISVVSLDGTATDVVDAGLQLGGYYVNLTRDDMAGLRYLLSTNNVVYESPSPSSVLVNSTGSTGGTNYGAPFLLISSNYAAFTQAALTNDPVTLSNLYPGLIILSYSNYPVAIFTTNYSFAYFTNVIGAPAGTQKPVYAPNVTGPTYALNYVYTFGNVIVFSNFYSPNSTATLLTTNVQQTIGGPAGTVTTNIVSTKTITLTGVPSGDFYINTNPCGPNLILYTFGTNSVATTNATVVGTNSSGYYSQTLITYSTTHAFWVEPIVCGNSNTGGTTSTNSPGLYEGIGKMQFIKTSYDSLTGIFYQPQTNTYTMVKIVNNQPVNQTYQRVATYPDFVFTAQDLAGGPNDLPVTPIYTRTINWDTANVLPGLAGPGTIDPGSQIIFNKVGSVYLNVANGNQTTATLSALGIATFDGSTNPPVIYPDGTSLGNLANQVLVNITPTSLPAGTNNVAYATTSFVATGGPFVAPFTWSLPSGGLPSGLSLSSGGTISGTPTQSGTFDFTLQLTDSLSHTVQWNYALTIQ